VTRQPRTLLTLLLVAVIGGTAFLIWRDLQPATEPVPEGLTPPAERPIRGGTLRSAFRSEPRTFNRHVSGSAATELHTLLTQARLVRINRATQVLEPRLAERWDVSADGLVFTLTLRDGLRWSDGEPFSADDVVFSLDAVHAPSSVIASTLSVAGRPIAATAPDPRTVVLTYPAPFGPGLRLLDNLPIIPRHKLGPALDAGTFAQAWGAATPPAELAGLGPFQLSSYEPGQRLVYTRNPNYWLKAEDGTMLPYLDELILEIIPDQNAELLRLQAGEIDMLAQHVRPGDLATLRPLVTEGKVNLIELGVGTDPDVFFFNLRDRHWARDPRSAWITRRELRQAISHALDREAFAETVFLGAAVPIWGPVSPGNTGWFSPNVPRYPYSPDKAKALLESIGLTNRDADPWLEDAQGHEARFTLLTFRGNLILEREASLLRDELARIGLAVDVVPLEANALTDRLFRGDFESIYFNYTATDLDPAMSKDFWLSSGDAHIWNMPQPTSQPAPATDWEAEIDRLMLAQASALDPDERRRLFAEVQRIFGEHVPALYFVAPRLYLAVSTRVVNLTPSVLRPQLLWSADTIAVKP
jgi:peptide/nickel transport system substrate-binding protein